MPPEDATDERPVSKDLTCRIVPRRARDAATGVRARTAHIQATERSAIGAVAEDRPCRPELIERHVAVHDVAVDQAELPLEPLGTEDHPAEDRRPESRRVALDRVDDRVGSLVFLQIPVAPVGKLRREMLAEQARNLTAGPGPD